MTIPWVRLRSVALLVLVFVLTFGATRCPADSLTDVSLVTVPGSTETIAAGINNSGSIVGAYRDPQSGQNEIGFVDENGAFSDIVFPGAAQTDAEGINNSGQIVGNYTVGVGPFTAFVDSNGTFSSIVIPGATNSGAYSINDSGQVVGYFTDSTGAQHGFICANFSCSTLNVPGAINTDALGINNQGDVTGWYEEADGMEQAYVYNSATGTFTTFNVSGATSTIAIRINDLGQVVGFFTSASGEQGFLYSDFSTDVLDLPNSPSTSIQGVNDEDQVVAFSGSQSYQARVAEPSSRLLLVVGATLLIGLKANAGKAHMRNRKLPDTGRVAQP